jgi:hypothetical protein
LPSNGEVVVGQEHVQRPDPVFVDARHLLAEGKAAGQKMLHYQNIFAFVNISGLMIFILKKYLKNQMY